MAILLLALLLSSGAPPESAPATVAAQAAEIRAVRWRLLEWRDAWERRDADAFLACFHPAYRADGVDRAALLEQKRQVFAKTEWIRVGISDLEIEVRGERATARFRQHYQSERHEDLGRKTLELIRENGNWLIASEAFASD